MSVVEQYVDAGAPPIPVRVPAVVSAQNLVKRYGQGDAHVDALGGISLEIEEGYMTAVMGPSGSGKSTLMHILAGLDQPTEGKVSIAGLEISSMSDRELTRLRREHIGFVFQFFNLLPMLTAEENIVLPLSIAGEKVDRAWVEELLETVGIADRRMHRPSELSGGQQQRVSIARAARCPADGPVRRRADRQPRLEHLERRARAAARFCRRPRADDRDGHSRPPGCGTGRSDPVPR